MMDAIYYWLGAVVFWLWALIVVWFLAESLIDWRRERRAEKELAENDRRLN